MIKGAQAQLALKLALSTCAACYGCPASKPSHAALYSQMIYAGVLQPIA